MTREEHLIYNLSCEDYSSFLLWNRGCLEYSKENKLTVNNIPEPLLKKINKNFLIAEERVGKIKLREKPGIGDFIRVKDPIYSEPFLFRLAILLYEDKYQYTQTGSFYMGDGYFSYSGGFCFDYGSFIYGDKCKPTNDLKEGTFWFFSNNDVRGGYGVHFKGMFKIWDYEYEKKENKEKKRVDDY